MFNFFSSACVLCDSSVEGENSLCKDCYDELPWMPQACKRCGVSLKNTIGIDKGSNICGACQSKPVQVDYTLSALQYLSPVDYLITELKFNQKLTSAAILSDLLFHRLQYYYQQKSSINFPDIIIPVPLHNKRLVTRGFNQAVEIGESISKKFSIPLCKNAVIRSKDTKSQSQLNAVQRNKNIRNSFELKTPYKLSDVSHIVILDDVVTTGATCNELAGLLKKAGIETVGVWSVARA